MSQVAKNLENRYNAPVAATTVWNPVHHVSGFTFPLMPVVANSPTLKIGLAQWGLIPSWVKDTEQAAQM